MADLVVAEASVAAEVGLEAADYLVVEAQVETGNKFLNPKEEQLLAEQIRKIERGTTAEVRIHISTKNLEGDALEAAKLIFQKLKMHETSNRNGILIFLSLKARKIAIFGDQGIDAFVKKEGWEKIVSETIASFKAHDYYIGLSHALDHLGRYLAENFPAGDSANANELSNEISRD